MTLAITINTELYTAEISELAHQNGLLVHLDGARIFNAAVALGIPAAELAKPVDSVCFCLSKSLSAPVGSLLCGTREFVMRARKFRKMLGGGMRQSGIVAAAGIVAIFMLALKVSNFAEYDNEAGYQVIAEFENIGGLKVRSPVTMAGVRVGRVSDISLNSESYNAKVTLNLYGDFDMIPTDTAASIYTAGLLGEQYIALEAGAEDEFLQDGDVLDLTQPALVLEQVIGQFLFSKAEGDE